MFIQLDGESLQSNAAARVSTRLKKEEDMALHPKSWTLLTPGYCASASSSNPSERPSVPGCRAPSDAALEYSTRVAS